ncbi:ATP-dependent 26S proteasome regulatory subunit [Anaerotaenia torta]|uniref:AAA family ATPase n=1 Tax=Anaerotaenia torta TaxID=433293 RepID=UPI003D1DCB21
MGLTDNQQRLIRAIAENDIRSAKKCAVACLTEDTTQKNQWFCKRYKTIFEMTGANMYELPQDLKGLLTVEDVSLSFKEGRYFLSDREKEVFENIVRMKKVNERLVEMGIPYINSTLLYGESGTGKTTFGRYVAFKTGLPFCYMNFSHLVDSYMGGTSRNISKAFTYAISNPCVFMLDEVDCISIRREDSGTSGGSGGEMARVTITLMQEFDKLPNDVIVIGATNRIDRIDEALLRRFSVKHEVEVLDEAEKIGMVRKYLHDVNMDFPVLKIAELVNKNKNQSMLLNDLIRVISEKIAEEVA